LWGGGSGGKHKGRDQRGGDEKNNEKKKQIANPGSEKQGTEGKGKTSGKARGK